MTYEVEMKFPLVDSASLISQLNALGAVSHKKIEQSDRYFNHPARDFAETDEVLRIRMVADRSFVTYKGPLLDAVTKTRQETEIQFGTSPGDSDRFHEMLVNLGFRPVREVKKTRTPYSFEWENREFEVVFDDVIGLGWFVEVETTVEEADRPAATDSLLRLATQLGLENSTRRSYLGMLLEADAGND